MNEAKLKLWKSQYTPKGQHGIEHCKNVETYGVCLARELGADEDVIRWFAYIHDSFTVISIKKGNNIAIGPAAINRLEVS